MWFFIFVAGPFLAMILRLLVGFALIATMSYGIYVLFFHSFMIGLMFIGGAVVSGWIANFIFALMGLVGDTLARITMRRIEDRRVRCFHFVSSVEQIARVAIRRSC